MALDRHQRSISPRFMPYARSSFRRAFLRISHQTSATIATLTTAITAQSQVINNEKIGSNGSIASAPDSFWRVGEIVVGCSFLVFVIVLAALIVFRLYIAPLLRGSE